jgi:ABC-type uncharacterized transport system substrate-binding protein
LHTGRCRPPRQHRPLRVPSRQRADALLVQVDALFNDEGEFQIIALATQHRLPTMTANISFTTRGGLISYGADARDLNRQAGLYVARLLRGEKPADLPVVQPTNFALRVNLKTAKTDRSGLDPERTFAGLKSRIAASL